jgi:hypothetical protein
VWRVFLAPPPLPALEHEDEGGGQRGAPAREVRRWSGSGREEHQRRVRRDATRQSPREWERGGDGGGEGSGGGGRRGADGGEREARRRRRATKARGFSSGKLTQFRCRGIDGVHELGHRLVGSTALRGMQNVLARLRERGAPSPWVGESAICVWDHTSGR